MFTYFDLFHVTIRLHVRDTEQGVSNIASPRFTEGGGAQHAFFSGLNVTKRLQTNPGKLNLRTRTGLCREEKAYTTSTERIVFWPRWGAFTDRW